MSTDTPLSLALFALRVSSPALALLATLSLVTLRPTHHAEPTDVTLVVVATRTPRRAAILTLLSLVALTFLLNGLDFVAFAVIDKKWPQRTGIEVNAVLGLLAFAGMAVVGAWKDIIGVNVWDRKRVKTGVFATLLVDIALATLSLIRIKKIGRVEEGPAGVDAVLTIARVLLLVPLLVTLSQPRVTYTSVISDVEETPPTASSLLLPHDESSAPSTGLAPLAAKDGGVGQYGTFRSTRSGFTTRANTPSPSHIVQPKPARKNSKEIALDPSWSETRQRIGRIAPHLWPSKSRSLQLLALACLGLLVLGRVVNFLLPVTLGKLIETLTDKSGSPWTYLLVFVALRYLQSSGGIGAVRDIFWAPVMQYSDREMSQLSFDHLLNLSLAFHTRRKTGEVLRILDRGAAINRIFELLLFNALAIFADIAIALGAFVFYFEWTLALVIFFDMVVYMAASVILTRWRTKLRREMNDRDVITRGIHTDCLLNYETVKYFNGEQHEGERYADAIRQYQALEYRVIMSLNLLNLVQNLILAIGLLVGSLIVALRVTRGQSKPSEFVIFITYIGQLYGPLAMLGSLYRSINQGLVDTEKLLKLLNEPTDVNDKPDATDLIVTDGEIEFDNVNFSYDGRTTALNGVSFKVPKGSSVALVGESGSGKSTILRLLYRFYDLKEGDGRILIDGQDIRDVTQSSLRKAIGVVPQDSVLFNASIEYNIGYGKFGASKEEIENAARAAQMHERILTFPDGYKTTVGERGVRLSGGEKQRVAIARTLLKNPPVLLLDEATSALDTSTEKDIQKALQNLVKGRSSLSIAHRLSTIASADVIVVLKDGQIVEHGGHGELLALNGVFASMWADQVSGSDDGVVSSHGGEAGDGDVKDGPARGYTVDEEPELDNLIDLERSTEPEVPPTVSEKPSYAAIVADRLVDEPASESPSASSTALAPEAPARETATASAEVTPAAEAPIPEAKVEAAVEDAEVAPVTFPTSPTTEEPAAPATFPASDPTPSEAPTVPISFPSAAKSDDTASQAPSGIESPPVQSPGVTFGPEVGSPSPRTGTPDPNAEPKRKRISSQNFQRLARRISISGRRQGSQSSIPNLIPSLRRGDSSSTPRESTSKDEGSARGEGSIAGANPDATPESSIQGKDKKDKKKDKKEKKKTLK